MFTFLRCQSVPVSYGIRSLFSFLSVGRLSLDPWAASKIAHLKTRFFVFCIMTLPTIMFCNVALRCVHKHFSGTSWCWWWSCDNTKQMKTLNAMMSHDLIQAFAEHEKEVSSSSLQKREKVLFIVFIYFISSPNTMLKFARRRSHLFLRTLLCQTAHERIIFASDVTRAAS